MESCHVDIVRRLSYANENSKVEPLFLRLSTVMSPSMSRREFAADAQTQARPVSQASAGVGLLEWLEYRLERSLGFDPASGIGDPNPTMRCPSSMPA